MRAALGDRGAINNVDLIAFTTWLNGRPGLEDAGYAGGASDHRTRSSDLWWHEPESERAQELLAAARAEARRRGIQLTVTAVPWSRTMIRRAAEVAFGPEGPRVVGFEVTGMEDPTPPFNVLLLFGDLPHASPDDLTAHAARARRALNLPIPVALRHRAPRIGRPWG